MRADLGILIAAALVAACGAKTVDLGIDPANAKSGPSGVADAGGSASNDAKGGAAPVGSSGNGSGADGSVPQACGDGDLDPDEACDDGNDRSGDGCSANCTVEAGWACVTGTCGWICGDHLTAGPEQCAAGACPATHVAAPDPAPAGAERGPCDIYAEDGGPCVAAHSTVRALYATYAGPLYQVKNGASATLDIGPTIAGGFADSAAQDSFCTGGSCTISIIYDQSGQGNHLTKSPAGAAKATPGNEANAAAVSATFGGRRVYGVHVVPGVAYRNNNACGTATGDNPETEYMIVTGDVYNGG
ncbi:MAG TPA: arabinofuranosidase catalytic domain-containing protein, partial [Polyangiaceae bacterium]